LQLCISPWTLDYFNKGTSTVVPQVYLWGTLSNDDCFAACRIRILLTVTWLHVIQFILCKIWRCWMQQTTGV
jgi:hypothetical protein